MDEKVIWNDDHTMNFIATAYNGARIRNPSDRIVDEGTYEVRVYLKGSIRGTSSGMTFRDAGLCFQSYPNEDSAKKGLERLVAKLRRAGLEGEE